ncbi:MAG: Holliday junction resolvase RuvX [Chloroflexi bacterium]|nr:Holliday junction resolvase RuvX [Chloroflexota bacterium]
MMGLDLGQRRIGLAVCHGTGRLVIPAGHLDRQTLKQDIDRLLDIARERQIEAFVAGLPYTLAGEVGAQAKRAQGFVRALRRRTNLPVYTVDERFTTYEAEGLLREAGEQPSKRRGLVDATAAALILERFLAEENR